MSEPNAHDEPAASRLVRTLPELAQVLREQGFAAGPRELLAIQRVLVELADRPSTPSIEDLERYLAPVIVKEAHRAAEFRSLLRSWLTESPASPPEPPAVEAGPSYLKSSLTLIIQVLVAVAISAVLFRIPRVPDIGLDPGGNVTEIVAPWTVGAVAFFTVLALVGAWIAWRRMHRSRFAESRKVEGRFDPLRGEEKLEKISWPLRSQVEAMATALKTRFRRESPKLDMERSLMETARRGGLFVPVYSSRRRPSEYLLLVDRRSWQDHQARFALEMFNELADRGARLTTWELDPDAQLCQSVADRGRLISLTALVGRHPDHWYIVVTGAETLVDPITCGPARWLIALQPAARKAILTAQPPGPAARQAAKELAYELEPLSPKGVTTLFDDRTDDLENQRHRWLSLRPLPRFLDRIRNSWSVEPSQERTEDLVGELRWFLGRRGFRWIAACAWYPELRWRLTLHLGSKFGACEATDFEQGALPDLMRLPWFRSGSMPSWLRQKLFREMSRDDQKQAREVINNFLKTSSAPSDSPAADTSVEIFPELAGSIFPALYQAQPAHSPVRDRVFAGAMSGVGNYRLPEWLERLLYRYSEAASRVLLIVALAIAAGAISAFITSVGYTRQAIDHGLQMSASWAATIFLYCLAIAAGMATAFPLGMFTSLKVGGRLGVRSKEFLGFAGAVLGGALGGAPLGMVGSLLFATRSGTPVIDPRLVVAASIVWPAFFALGILRLVRRGERTIVLRAVFQGLVATAVIGIALVQLFSETLIGLYGGFGGTLASLAFGGAVSGLVLGALIGLEVGITQVLIQRALGRSPTSR